MAISFGPKLGLLYNALIGESYFDSLRLFLQSVDQLINGSVINATQVSPPTSPNPGDAYLLIGGTPGGAWTGQAGNIAVWDAQLTNSGTNTVVPGWVFLVPKAGWTVWNIATTTLSVFNGTSWGPVGSGANFPTNTDITSLTGIPNTTISTAGYLYSDGTLADTSQITPSGWAWGNTAGNFDANTGGIFLANQAFTGTGYTGIGLAVQNSSGVTTVVGAGQISTATIGSITINNTGTTNAGGTLRVGTGTVGTPALIQSFATGQRISIGPLGSINTNPQSVTNNSGTSTPTTGVGLLSFGANYFTQTTVGAAGGASALPATPTG